MLNKFQIEDSKECEEMQLTGEDKECFGCSCSVCIAQVPKDYKTGLNKAIDIINGELEFTRTVNPQMAMGMSQIKNLILKELSN